MKNAWYDAGWRYGRKIGGGFCPDPNGFIRLTAKGHVRRAETLAAKVEIEREFTAGALAGYRHQIAVDGANWDVLCDLMGRNQ